MALIARWYYKFLGCKYKTADIPTFISAVGINLDCTFTPNDRMNTAYQVLNVSKTVKDHVPFPIEDNSFVVAYVASTTYQGISTLNVNKSTVLISPGDTAIKVGNKIWYNLLESMGTIADFDWGDTAEFCNWISTRYADTSPVRKWCKAPNNPIPDEVYSAYYAWLGERDGLAVVPIDQLPVC